MSIRFERRALPEVGDDAQALLIVPEAKLRVGTDRLRSDPNQGSAVDKEIAHAARPLDDGVVRVSIFCAQAPEGDGSWGFDEDLSLRDGYALARHLVRSQLHVLRSLFACGVCMHVRIDFGGKEQLAFRRATLDVRRELESAARRATSDTRELAELDAWLLRNFVFFFAVPVDRLMQSTLGENAAAVRTRMRQAQRQRQRLTPALVERLAG